jgi:TPR repeat protein
METPRLPSESRAELANWPGLDGLVMRMLAKNREDRPQDAEVLSEFDAMQSGPIQRRTEQTAEFAHAPTIIERDWGHREQAVAAFTQPAQQTFTQSVSQPFTQSVPQPVTRPVTPDERRKERSIPVWAWGALAVLVLAAVFAMAWILASKPQPQQTQATANQSAVIPPLQAGASDHPSNSQTSVSQKPPQLLAGNTKPTLEKPTSSQIQNSSQVSNTPSPAVKLPNLQPSISDITKLALTLYGQKNFSMAAPLLDKACTGGSGEACKDLGNLYHDGNSVGKDGLRAASLYSKACSTSAPMGCNSLGVMYHNGDGVAPDDTRAANLYSQACNAGDALGCTNLGNSYWNGKGVPHDDARAATLYSRACDSSNAAGCSSLGLCYLSGRGVGKDYDKAKQYFTTGCKMGNSWGCDQLKMLK